MFHRLTSRLTTGLAAAALALTTALPTPAAAMSDKDRQLLTLLLGAAVVGAIIHDANKEKKKPAPPVARYDDRYRRTAQGWKFERVAITMKMLAPYDEGWAPARIRDVYAALRRDGAKS